ncbi:MAG: DUF2339 domain-containing protein [Proteobacteria bacterium]|nr:DUF2339 domain-containing protein [Pseudomonadota bacterium]
MFAEAGFFVLLGMLLVGYLLGVPFILWLKSREAHEEQEKLGKWASTLDQRLARTEKELAALRLLVAERPMSPASPEVLPPVLEPTKAQATLDRLAAANVPVPESAPLTSAPVMPPVPPPIPPTVSVTSVSVPLPPPPSPVVPVPPRKPVASAPVAPPEPAFNLEQFLGVKLFAWVGAFIGFLAVAFALKYSFDQGWVSPAVRVAGGLVTGIALLIGGLKMNRERYAVTVQSLCGAGIVVLYADLFTAHHPDYNLIPSPTATFLLMSLVTTVAFFLAVRLNAQPVAILGLLGGFLTPVLISTGQDNPLGLFGYVTLLDVGLLAVALRQRWLHLTLLAGVATVLMQFAWASKFFAVEKIGVAMTVFVFFSALFFTFFSVVHRMVAKAADVMEEWSSYAAVLMPSVGLFFAFFIFAHPYRELAERPGLMFSFIFLLDLALLGVAWTRAQLRPVQLLAGGASFFLLMVWTGGFLTNDLLNWSLGFTLLFAVLHAVFPVVQQRLQPNLSPVWWMHLYPPIALLLVLIPLFKLDAPSFLVWPVVLLVDVLAIGLALFTASLASIAIVLLLTVLVTACWISRVPAELTGWTGLPGMLLVIGGFAVFFFAAAFFALKRILPKLEAAKADPKNASGLPISGSVTPELAVQLSSLAAVLPFLLLTMVLLRVPLTNPSPVFGLAVLLIALLLGVVRRFGTDLLAPVAIGCTLLLEFVWHGRHFAGTSDTPDWLPLAWHVGFSAIFTLFPFVCHRQVAERRLPWAVAALALPLHFHLIYRLCKANLPDFGYLGLIPAVCALPAFAGLVWLLKKLPTNNEGRNALLALFGGATLLFVTLIFPIQFDKQWLTVAWALEGVALLWLFHRVPHPGLPLVGVALLCVAFVRLALNGEVFSYHARSTTPIFNWYLYAYGIVTVCLFAGARLLAPPRNKVQGTNILPLLYSLGTVLAFILVNIEIADYFSEGTRTTFELFGGNLSREKQLGRDMTYSLAWSAFAFVLLVIGFRQRVTGARRAGMALLGVTLVKLFFHDLWQLGGLYRIGALIGLAVVLMLVSMFYQKFLATEAEQKAPAPTDAPGDNP